MSEECVVYVEYGRERLIENDLGFKDLNISCNELGMGAVLEVHKGQGAGDCRVAADSGQVGDRRCAAPT